MEKSIKGYYQEFPTIDTTCGDIQEVVKNNWTGSKYKSVMINIII